MLEFPFPEKNKYQDDIINEIFNVLNKRKNLMVSAPTGIGKTISALYPLVNFAFANNKKIFFLTSKTTQQRIVVDTLRKMHIDDVNFRITVLTAKEKICSNNLFYCHPNFCPFIKDYYSKLENSKVLKKISKHNILDPKTIRKYAVKNIICPYELSMELLSRSNLIICDYNYIFDPSIKLKPFFQSVAVDDCIILIDEAHNLYFRGRDYYSPYIESLMVQKVLYHLTQENDEMPDLIRILTQLHEKLVLYNDLKEETIKDIDKDFFVNIMSEFSEYIADYFSYKKTLGHNLAEDPVKDLYYQFEKFINVLLLSGEEFKYIAHDKKLKILCLDPSNMLKSRIDSFYSTIAMSATLEPSEFYMDVLGFSKSNSNVISYPSPFPTENRKILVIPEVSTKYKERDDNYEKIAQIINEVISIKQGHYFAFFPSYNFLKNVYKFVTDDNYEILMQESGMDETKKELFFNKLKSDKNILILAVHGGIFSEGVDYPGDMLIGVMAIGPALPAYSFEQELIKDYFKKKYNKGFEYSYLYPGMTRVIQSVGRVIRSKEDKGIIALLDNRFKNPYYNSLFPNYWYKNSPKELISDSYKKDIKEFWENVK